MLYNLDVYYFADIKYYNVNKLTFNKKRKGEEKTSLI